MTGTCSGAASSSSGNFRGVSLGNIPVPYGCTEENGLAAGVRYASSCWPLAELSKSFGAMGPPVVLAGPPPAVGVSALALRFALSRGPVHAIDTFRVHPNTIRTQDPTYGNELPL